MSKQKGSLIISIIVIVIVALISITGTYLFLKNQNTSSNQGKLFCGGIAGIVCPDGYFCKYNGNYPDASGICFKNPSALPNPKQTGQPSQKECTADTDCIIAFEINNSNCCNCPFSTSRKELVGNKNLVEYEPGKDYSKTLPASCNKVVCEPCEPPPTESYCLNNVCSMKAESEITETVYYTACGCGCCDKTTPVVKCLYKSKGDDLDKIITGDEKAKLNPGCAYAGCSTGIIYKYCD